MRIIVATQNSGKVQEIRSILSGMKIEVCGASEFGITEEAPEDGRSLEENALQKARFVAGKMRAEKMKGWVLADDTGLFIDALGGAPGIHPKRWVGEVHNEYERVDRVLRKLDGIPEAKRGAGFSSVVAIISPESHEWTFRGDMRATIPTTPRGTMRPTLPYDVLIVPEGHDRTFAEMTEHEKNAISHRGKAFELVKKFLADQLKA